MQHGSPYDNEHSPIFMCMYPPTVTMVLGIPTVKREKQSYLVSTLSSLLSSLTSSESKDLLIIVFVAEVTYSFLFKSEKNSWIVCFYCLNDTSTLI